MNNKNLKHLTNAHSWLGIIISAVLFIVFFCGSLSLFLKDMEQWSVQPHFPVQTGTPLSISELAEKSIEGRAFNAKEHLVIRPANEQTPFAQAYVDILSDDPNQHFVGLLMQPTTGEVVAETESFHFPYFLYELHVDLHLPGGEYLVGFITLFFFFAIVSGIVIHAKKLFKRFFFYRSDNNTRSKMLDMHNVAGVISLPYTLMYAITGLVFNLVLIYQIAFAVILYQGDQKALLKDAGVVKIAPEWQNQPTQYHKQIDAYYQSLTERFGQPPAMVRFYNYGDASAIVEFRGPRMSNFTGRYEYAYQLSDGHIVMAKPLDNPNALATGLAVLVQLHFANFAGFDLRILYFLLGLGVCMMIITGNLLWIEQKSKQRHASTFGLNLVKRMTLASTCGLMLATVVGFWLERTLPTTLPARGSWVIYGFLISLGVYALLPFHRSNYHDAYRQHISTSLQVCAALLIGLVAFDWLIFTDTLLLTLNLNELSVLGTQVGMLLVSIVLLFAASKLRQSKQHMDNGQPIADQQTGSATAI